jgi:beta-glucosidase
MQQLDFPKNFFWGAATASYQIEGAKLEDGKGESIWDRFCRVPGKIRNGHHGDIACDHYHRYEEDIKILKKIGVNTYRYSISWPRIFPEGTGKPNPKGMDFYKRITNLLLESDIKPAITLYHWDLPQKLQDIGGWANHSIVDYFQEYAGFVFQELGDIVPIWFTINEPWVIAFEGHWLGVNAPGITDFKAALQVSHHLLLAHGLAVKTYRESRFSGEIGIVLNMQSAYPGTNHESDHLAATRLDGYHNRWFSDPVFKGEYPTDMIKWYKEKNVLPKIFQAGDMKYITQPIDFLGLNYYTSSLVYAQSDEWPLMFKTVPAGSTKTSMGWGIYPEGFYDLLMRLSKNYPGIRILITENGTACNDFINRKGMIEDDNRIDYHYQHLLQILKTIRDGAHIDGYYLWSLMDNFEWAEGYDTRFGIVYIDYASQKRTLKKSAEWYRQVIQNNRLMDL